MAKVLPPEPFWTGAQRRVLLLLLGALLVYQAVRAWRQPATMDDPQMIAGPRAEELEDRIDPNIAEWTTLASLPQLGEKRARQIVVYRQQFIDAGRGSRPFQSPTDLLKVPGVGPAMIERIGPCLRFDPPPTPPISSP